MAQWSAFLLFSNVYFVAAFYLLKGMILMIRPAFIGIRLHLESNLCIYIYDASAFKPGIYGGDNNNTTKK